MPRIPICGSRETGSRTKRSDAIVDRDQRVRRRPDRGRRSGTGNSGRHDRVAGDLQTRDRVPLESPRQLRARLGHRDGAHGSFGPFLDEHGLQIWFDIFHRITLVTFYLAGVSAPILRARVPSGACSRAGCPIASSRQRVDCRGRDRTGGCAAGLLHGPQRQGRALDLSLAATRPGRRSSSMRRRPRRFISNSTSRRPRTPRRLRSRCRGGGGRPLPKPWNCGSRLRPAASRQGRLVHGVRLHHVLQAVRPGASIGLPLISQILVPFSAARSTDAPDHFEIAPSESALCVD